MAEVELQKRLFGRDLGGLGVLGRLNWLGGLGWLSGQGWLSGPGWLNWLNWLTGRQWLNWLRWLDWLGGLSWLRWLDWLGGPSVLSGFDGLGGLDRLGWLAVWIGQTGCLCRRFGFDLPTHAGPGRREEGPAGGSAHQANPQSYPEGAALRSVPEQGHRTPATHSRSTKAQHPIMSRLLSHFNRVERCFPPGEAGVRRLRRRPAAPEAMLEAGWLWPRRSGSPT